MYLIHHGRKGQSWGVTNGPPYPLDQPNSEYKKKQSVNKGKEQAKKTLAEFGKRMSKTLMNSATLAAASSVVTGILAASGAGVAIGLAATAVATSANMAYDKFLSK